MPKTDMGQAKEKQLEEHRERLRKAREESGQKTCEPTVTETTELPADAEEWLRDVDSANKKLTPSRELFQDGDLWKWECPDEVTRHVKFLWMSDMMLKRRTMMRNFNVRAWQPMTPEMMKKFKLKVNTPDRTPEGYPRIGLDAVLHWCPREYADAEQRKRREAGLVGDKLKSEARRMKERLQGHMIGDIQQVDSIRELTQAEQAQRAEMKTPIRG